MEPVFQTDLTEPGIVSRNQRALAEFGPEVPRLRIDDHLAGIVARSETLADQLVETEPLGTGHFNSAVQWRAHSNPGNGLGDIISRHGLNEYRWEPNSRSVSRVIGHALDELEELRRVDD